MVFVIIVLKAVAYTIETTNSLLLFARDCGKLLIYSLNLKQNIHRQIVEPVINNYLVVRNRAIKFARCECSGRLSIDDLMAAAGYVAGENMTLITPLFFTRITILPISAATTLNGWSASTPDILNTKRGSRNGSTSVM